MLSSPLIEVWSWILKGVPGVWLDWESDLQGLGKDGPRGTLPRNEWLSAGAGRILPALLRDFQVWALAGGGRRSGWESWPGVALSSCGGVQSFLEAVLNGGFCQVDQSPPTPCVLCSRFSSLWWLLSFSAGVKRCLSEMEEGKVNLENNCSPYYLIRLIYSSENFDKLVNLSKYNILNNKDLLLQAIRSAVERRRSSRTGNLPSHSGAGYP